MSTLTQPSPIVVAERLDKAMNQHNLEAFLECFDPSYQSEQPVHPDRAFSGIEQVHKNWSSIFNGVPDFQAELLRSAVAGDSVWSEWHWQGTRVDGTSLNMRGVIIFGTRNDRIIWGRLYVEPVDESGTGIDASITTITGGTQQEN